MKVSELLALLQAAAPDAEVILQKDSEGNGFSPLYGADPDCIYVPNGPYSGEVYGASNTAENECLEEDEWEEIKQHPRCMVLYPLN